MNDEIYETTILLKNWNFMNSNFLFSKSWFECEFSICFLFSNCERM